jgi:hypothetical protein
MTCHNWKAGDSNKLYIDADRFNDLYLALSRHEKGDYYSRLLELGARVELA